MTIRARRREGADVAELMRFETASGAVVVEVGDGEPGFELVDRTSVIANAKLRLESALAEVHDAAAGVLRTFRTRTLDPDAIEVTFGVKLNAEAGAIIARATTEAHFQIKLTWNGTMPDEDEDEPADAG